MKRIVISANTSKGVVAYGASATLEGSVVRRSKADKQGQMGQGFQLIEGHLRTYRAVLWMAVDHLAAEEGNTL